ncbi:hypothetical protein L0N06_17730 [Flavonifractor plautii]|uniref:hypothetical protein n=1 Tax=Flavonifractor plautii TaxID=292800 RepID=UPI001EDFDA40|nr:hypothetical protein [Flavonifractor plautii]MCG4658283.1 hypothetical protein [Flavonifractor plautii]
MSRYKNNLYTIERRVWKNHELCLVQNEDFTLFSGHHRTKIVEEDLPEWYVFGRYYKMWGFLSTKGITDLRYIPNMWINHFLKDDCLLISYGGKIEEKPGSSDCDKYSGVDERVWGNEILNVLKGAKVFSGYDIAPIVEKLREKKRVLIENHPDEFGPQRWNFDIDKWLAEEYNSGRPTCFSRANTERREAELRAMAGEKRGDI